MNDLLVIDFSANAAGPACAMLLADFGAEVIKIEPPGGDATRKWGKCRFGADGQFTGSYLSLNRNKAGIVLDLKTKEGKQAAIELIKRADVLIHSYLPAVAAKLGLDTERVAKLNPRLVQCSISGFASGSPMGQRPGFDMLMQAFAGHLAITGEQDRPSVRIGPSSIDLVTAAHAAFGIMVALRERESSGLGQAIEASLYDNAMHLIGNHIGDFTGSGTAPGKFGSRFANMSPYGYYQAADGEFFIGVSSDEMWRRFCAKVEAAKLLDEKFATNHGRLSRQKELDALLGAIFAAKPAAHWVALAEGLSIPASPIHDIPGAVAHEQAASILVDTGVDGVKIPGIPVRLSRTPGKVRRHAPSLGEDTARILDGLKPARVAGAAR